MRVVALLLLATAAACSTQECFTDPMTIARDPTTGVCVDISNEDGCAYCFTEGLRCVAGDARELDYAPCRGPCDGVAEAACLTTDGCRAAYRGGQFFACWNTAPSGPIDTGACIGLDAHACSRHDNCTSWFAGGDAAMVFDHCDGELPVSVMAPGA